MLRWIPLAAALPLIAGCLSHPPPPPAPYRAVAKAPANWTLIIDDRFVTFIAAPGQQPLLQPAPKPIVGVAGDIYRTPRIEVNIVHQPCTDGRTSITYPDSVQVYVDSQLHSGCGGL